MTKDMYDYEKEFLEKFPYRLSRKVETELPTFKSKSEAVLYFDNTYGPDNFKYADFHENDSESGNLYIYHLVVHKENYEKHIDELIKTGYTSGTEGIMSYHPVEINEDGSVHIVY